ncbi:MAG TPA: F0F1 ATP synthase subunit B [Burkholderiaceae bacterium]|nr:F0F1 ATP synthase subunit B [Burkholderiaceae bacterium]
MSVNLTLFFQTAVLFILGWITMTFIWPPLIRAIEDRQRKIAEGLAAADKGSQSLKEAEKRIAKLDAEARQRAADIVAQTEKRAQKLIDEAKAQAKAEGDRLLAGAKAEIEQEAQRARAALRDQVAALAVAGAESILKREIDAAKHADLLGQLKAQL